MNYYEKDPNIYDKPDEYLQILSQHLSKLKISNETIHALLPDLLKISCQYKQPIRIGLDYSDSIHIFIGKPNGHALWGILMDSIITFEPKIVELSNDVENNVKLICQAVADIIKDHTFN